MKTRTAILIILFTLVFAGSAYGDTQTGVNGYMHTVDGQRVLHVWGSHYDMGYAQGYFLGEDIIRGMTDYALALLPKAIYIAGHFVVPALYEFPDEYYEEANGIIAGITESGIDTWIPALERNLDVGDLVFANALGDLGAMACSSILAWGQSTVDDERLAGDTAVIRNLDWAMAGPDKYFLSKATAVIVYSPTIPGQQTVASVTFPGFIGCLSCMNEQGVTGVINIAHNGVGLLGINYTQKFTHVEISLRQALHAKDIDGDGRSTIHDAVQNITDSVRGGAIVVNLAEPADRTALNPALVLEVDNQGHTIRTPEDEPNLPLNTLLATNDLRKLHPFFACDRYATMARTINDLGGALDVPTMWEIEGTVIQDSLLSTTAQTIYFLPTEREIGVAYTDHALFSPEKTPSVIPWNKLIELPEGVELPENDSEDDDDDQDYPESNSNGEDTEEDLCCG